MVVKKIYRKKSRTAAKARKNTKVIAKRALRMVKALSPEVKKSFVQQVVLFPEYAGAITRPLVGIVQGTGDAGNRIGDKITLIRHVCSWEVFNNSNNDVSIRFVCLQIKKNAGGTVTPSTVANYVYGSAVTTSTIMLAPVLYDNRENVRILYDKIHTIKKNSLATSGTSGTPTDQVYVNQAEKYIKINLRPNRNIQYNGATNDVLMNDIYWIAFTRFSANGAITARPMYKTYYTDC